MGKTQQICALYCRLSKDDLLTTGDSNSIINQKEMLSRFAKEQGFQNTQFFVDDGYSGATFNRPAVTEMLNEIKAGNVYACVCKDLSRFGRNYIEVGMHTEITMPAYNVRFIAIQDGVDSAQNSMEFDFTPMKNFFNEMQCKDTSRKVRAVKRNKALAGKHDSSNAPYGYKPSDEDKFVWAIDERAADVVREIFSLCMNGHGPFQIAEKLKLWEIEIPAVHNKRWKSYTPKYSPYNWCASIVSTILSNEVYIGTAILNYTHKLSYKNKKQVTKPREEWIIHENAHPAIIDQETFETVQRLREGKRRRTSMGDMHMLAGMMFCPDCGKRLTLMRARARADYQYYVCGEYRRHSTCTRHTIRSDIAQTLMLDDIRRVCANVAKDETAFIQSIVKVSKRESEKSIRKAKSELAKSEARVTALDKIIQKIYEDNVEGKISDERFAKMLADYEEEQRGLQPKITELQTLIVETGEQTEGVDKFIKLVRTHKEIPELTAEILREFVERIEVHEPETVDGVKRQQVDIHYNYIGIIPNE